MLQSFVVGNISLDNFFHKTSNQYNNSNKIQTTSTTNKCKNNNQLTQNVMKISGFKILETTITRFSFKRTDNNSVSNSTINSCFFSNWM